ncbi:preprotein translocase subunit TatA [Gordoniibacillus kamchatkensis]|uniref:Sec-independent protein translocase protein TatA n=1 Tax=Gordoniibacillus kamchatkensis TaxID=1590651 RepID=A0ABR5APL2_9BACL|nr:twin-arginine translocase TatA/TatE family subunit [Paenibacillus sp. VKM B-2647]KIL42475.1 preprotein translocase subunit TatA [Paenibacillus sp. VKM B-2647]
MFNNIGASGLIIILLIALVVFGPAKLPQLGRAFGDTLREFRNSTKGIVDDDKDELSGEFGERPRKLL